MRKVHLAIVGLFACLLAAPVARAQPRPYIGFVYPAGGQQGTTFQVTLGGQNLDDVYEAGVSGAGVTARIVEYRRKLNPQEIQVLAEQLKRLKKVTGKGNSSEMMMMSAAPTTGPAAAGQSQAAQQMAERVQRRINEWVLRPAAQSLSSLVTVEVTIAPDASPGRRELTLATLRGVSNPLVFYIGQHPEVSRKPMTTAQFQVLGKEDLALRKRPDDEVEQYITLPATLNGQIASGETNRYRFQARKGQRLVFACTGRDLIPFLADASPGWFQPVMALYDPRGKEVAYDDDYRFKPDPVILYKVPADGEYTLVVNDALYRGREDFVYRIIAGEVPFITSIFPLGSRTGTQVACQLQGWNLDGAKLSLPPGDAAPGTYFITATNNKGFVSNGVPFRLEALPECAEQEPNNDQAHAQKVTLPIVVNGRIDRADDWDVFQFEGRAGQTIVADVEARRLESPLDSFVKITDASGKVLAFNDDYEDPEAGTNTQDADSYIMTKLPADGTYYVHVGDAGRHGGAEYAYRLRISEPEPDFSLRVVPTSVALRSKNSTAVTVQVIRKDGFRGPVKLTLKDPPAGFVAQPLTIAPGQAMTRFAFKTDLVSTKDPVSLHILGTATIGERTVTHVAVPAEDRMQAFLWRHFVPAQDLKALVFDPAYELPPARVPRAFPPTTKPVATSGPATNAAPPKFTKQQVVGRLRQLKLLFEEGLLTDEFYHELVEECEAVR